jgi:hypothetical protein
VSARCWTCIAKADHRFRLGERNTCGSRAVRQHVARKAGDIGPRLENRLHALEPEARRDKVVVEENNVGKPRPGERQSVVALKRRAWTADPGGQVCLVLIELADVVRLGRDDEDVVRSPGLLAKLLDQRRDDVGPAACRYDNRRALAVSVNADGGRGVPRED